MTLTPPTLLSTALRLYLAVPLLGSGVVSAVAPGTIGESGSPAAVAMFDGMRSTVLWGAIITVKITAAALLIAGRYVPLALAMAAPVTVSILLLETFEGSNSPLIGLSLLAAQGALVWRHRAAFLAALRAPASPWSAARPTPLEA